MRMELVQIYVSYTLFPYKNIDLVFFFFFIQEVGEISGINHFFVTNSYSNAIPQISKFSWNW